MKRLNMKHTLHDTRHACISLLTKADVNPTTIKKIVGHKSAMSLPEKVYTHMDYQTLLDGCNQQNLKIFRGFLLRELCILRIRFYSN
ncbi:hypothetical protein [Holdemanella biformis]|uniref:hypothetical protein n=1 Tax=Holdemanella biformis TaxID=1735 RepID=UPI0022E636E1|nr:hypothetical protein [Holdemanella biformis]